jgi:cyclophilin family peptidyl-prolyl cis-trans isomerase
MVFARWMAPNVTWAILAGVCWFTGCSGRAAPPAAPSEPVASSQAVAPAPTAAADPALPKGTRPPPVDPIVVLHTSAGDIRIELFAQQAPQTVDNFLSAYADRKFYDETIFHHVEPGMMLIGGGYAADLVAKPTRTPIYNESRNGLSNTRGTVAMICDPSAPHSATSQFFINLADNPNLDSQQTEGEVSFGYCVFGRVVEGLDVAEKISAQPTVSQGDFPQLPTPTVAIRSVERLR